MCNNPEFAKDDFIFLGGETASSPKTIPPKSSKFGEGKNFE